MKKKIGESLNLRDAGTACWWLWIAEIIDPVSLCWHISRAAWKKRGKKDAKRDERSWLRKDSQTNQVRRQLCEKTKNFSNVVASSNFSRLDSGPREHHCLASVPQIWFLLGCVSNHVGQGNKMRLPLVLIHNFIYIHNLHTWFEIHNKNVLDTSTAVWSKWNMTLFDTTSPEEAAEMQAFCADFEKAFKSSWSKDIR